MKWVMNGGDVREDYKEEREERERCVEERGSGIGDKRCSVREWLALQCNGDHK